MEPYVLIQYGRYTGLIEGAAFHTHRRLNWTVTINVASLASGGSVTLELQGSPDADTDDSFATRHSFGAISSVGETEVASFIKGASAADFTVAAKDLFLRGKVTAHTGTYVLEMRAVGRFVDIENSPSDENLLPSVLRESKATRVRFLDAAERDVIRWLMQGNKFKAGALALQSTDARVLEIVRDAIIEQAVRLQRAETLIDSPKEIQRRAGFRLKHGLDPKTESLLREVTDISRAVWLGR